MSKASMMREIPFLGLIGRLIEDEIEGFN